MDAMPSKAKHHEQDTRWSEHSDGANLLRTSWNVSHVDLIGGRCYSRIRSITLLLMSSSQLIALINSAKESPSILHRLDGTEDLDSVVAVAKEMGFNITADDLMKKAGIEISEGELEGCCATTGTVKTASSLCISCE